jgi:hypothetical protein
MSAGVEVRPEQMSNFRPGVATLREVTATLGISATYVGDLDGQDAAMYVIRARDHRAFGRRLRTGNDHPPGRMLRIALSRVCCASTIKRYAA